MSSAVSDFTAVKKTYLVTYNTNGGTGTIDDQYKFEGATLTLTSKVPTREGYMFVGWATGINVNKVEYKKGASYSLDKAVTLYAVWEYGLSEIASITWSGSKISWSASNDENNNEVTKYSVSILNGGSTVSTIEVTERTLEVSTYCNAVSANWSVKVLPVKASANNIIYTADGVISDTMPKPSAVQDPKWNVGTASWTDPNSLYGGTAKYTVTLLKNETNVETVNIPPDSNDLSSKLKTASANWTFKVKVTYVNSNGQEYISSSEVTSGTQSTYSITYNNTYNSSIAPTYKIYGETVNITTSEPTREGYKFLGWATEKNATTVTYSSGAKYSKDESIILYAVWKLVLGKPASVSWKGGTVNWTSVNYATSYKVEIYDGSTLKGTRTDTGNVTSYDVSSILTTAVTTSWKARVYAKADSVISDEYAETGTWATYKVTYNANGGTLTGVSEQIKIKDVSITLTGTATRSGYTFAGWGTAINATTVAYSSGDKYLKNASTTIYAIWQSQLSTPTGLYWDGSIAKWDAVTNAQSYTVTLCNGSTSVQTYTTTGTSYTVPATGFNGASTSWCFKVQAIANTSDVRYRNSDTATSGNLGLSAPTSIWWSSTGTNTGTVQWNAVSLGNYATTASGNCMLYQVTLYKNGAYLDRAWTGNTNCTFTFTTGGTYAVGVQAYVTYNDVGWCYVMSSETRTSGSQTVYTVTYNANGGSSTPASQVAIAGKVITLAGASYTVNSDVTVTATYNVKVTVKVRTSTKIAFFSINLEINRQNMNKLVSLKDFSSEKLPRSREDYYQTTYLYSKDFDLNDSQKLYIAVPAQYVCMGQALGTRLLPSISGVQVEGSSEISLPTGDFYGNEKYKLFTIGCPSEDCTITIRYSVG